MSLEVVQLPACSGAIWNDLSLNRVMQQSFSASVCPSLSLPYLYIWLRQISFESFNLLDNIVINAIL